MILKLPYMTPSLPYYILILQRQQGSMVLVLDFSSYVLLPYVFHYNISSVCPSKLLIFHLNGKYTKSPPSLNLVIEPLSVTTDLFLCYALFQKYLKGIVYSKVIDFLYPSFSLSQLGFVAGRSTLQQLLLFLSDTHNNSDNRLHTGIVYLDFRKAFDTVPHDKLLNKLWSMGITGNMVIWFRSYLSSRRQTVQSPSTIT